MEKIEKKKWTNDAIWKEVKSWIFIILIALGIKTTVIASYIVPTGSMEDTIMTGDFLIGNQFIYGMRSPDRLAIPFTQIGMDIPHFTIPGFRKVKQGDVVIFRYPVDHSFYYVKRCVAGPGQVVEIKDKQLYVDGNEFKNPKHLKYIRSRKYSKNYKDPRVFPYKSGNEDFYGPLYVPAENDTLYYFPESYEIIKVVAELAGHNVRKYKGNMEIDGIQSDYYVVEQNHYFMMGDNRDNSLDSRFWGYVPENLVRGKALFVFMSWNKNKPFSRFWEKIRWKRIGRVIS